MKIGYNYIGYREKIYGNYFFLNKICIVLLIWNYTNEKKINIIDETTERNADNIFFDWPQFRYHDHTGQHDTFLSVRLWCPCEFVHACLLNTSRGTKGKEINKDMLLTNGGIL